jgi:HSP20 family protein
MPTSAKKISASAVHSAGNSMKARINDFVADETQRAIQHKIQADKAEHGEGQLALDIYQTPTHIVIVAPIAGVKMPDIDVSVTEDVLTIKGKRYLEFDIPDEDYFTQECFWGDFSRSIVLPASVDDSKISASFKDAVLKITIPKAERVKTKIVRIKSE